MPTRAAAVCLWALCLAAPHSGRADSGELPGGPPAREGLFSFLVTGNLLRTQSFVTWADNAPRAVDGALDAMLVLRVGFNFML